MATDWWVYGAIILSMALTTASMVLTVMAERRNRRNRSS